MPTRLVPLAIVPGNPKITSSGTVNSEPPPASVLTIPAKSPTAINRAISKGLNLGGRNHWSRWEVRSAHRRRGVYLGRSAPAEIRGAPAWRILRIGLRRRGLLGPVWRSADLGIDRARPVEQRIRFLGFSHRADRDAESMDGGRIFGRKLDSAFELLAREYRF